jgi:hypothetical protein
MSDSEVAFPTPLALPLIHRFFGISRSGLSARIRFKYCGDNGLQLDFHVVMDLRVTTSSHTVDDLDVPIRPPFSFSIPGDLWDFAVPLTPGTLILLSFGLMSLRF